MLHFNNFSTRSKLIFGFGTMWIFMTILIAIAYYDLQNAGLSEIKLQDNYVKKAFSLMQIKSHHNQNHAELLQIILTNNKSDQQSLKTSIIQRQAEIDAFTNSLNRTEANTQYQGLIKQYKNLQNSYSQVRNNILISVEQGNIAEATRLAIDSQGKTFKDLQLVIDKLNDIQENNIDKQIAENKETAKHSLFVFIIYDIAAILLSFFIIAILNRTIALPINLLAKAAIRITENDDIAISFADDNRKDEIGKLAQALRQMMLVLRKIADDAGEMNEKIRLASLYTRSLIEAGLDPLFAINVDGKISDVNSATEQVTGVAREHLVGSDFTDYFTDPIKARDGYQEVFAMGIVRDFPLVIRHASGRTTDVLYNASVYKNEAGIVKGVFAAARDITDRKRMDDELKIYRDQLEEQVESRTSEITTILKDVKETASVLATASSEIITATTQVATGAAEAATAISETTTSVEEVRQAARLSSDKAKNVDENSQRFVLIAQSGQQAVEDTASGMLHIRDQMESIAQTIVRLSEQSQSIGGIIASVTDLADQSNLLAVNAAIEAARAGEHGRGFAIVAQEIKSLAEQSKQATTQIRNILSDVQKATGAAVMATEQGSKAVDAGVKQSAQAGEAIRMLAENTDEAAQVATQIVVSSQQQVVGMDQIGVAMDNINLASKQNAVSMLQVETAAKNLHELGQKLKQLVDDSKVV